MKELKRQLIALACFFLTLTVVSGAQTVGLTLDIPFPFNVGEKVLPAGHYTILAPQGDTLRVLGSDGVAAVTMTNHVSGTPPTDAGIVHFNCYGRQCFLSQFWTARTETGKEVLKSRVEKEVAGKNGQLVVLALKAMPYEEIRQNNTQ